MTSDIKRLIILSGPSCAGKTPMLKAVQRLHSDLFGSPILYSSRSPRPGEKDGIDFHFRPESTIRDLPRDRFVVGPVRHLWQAVDLDDIQTLSQRHSAIVIEIYPTLAEKVLEHPGIKDITATFELHTVFISPVTDSEIEAVQKQMGLDSPEQTLASIMSHKQISRAIKQGKAITLDEMDDIRKRASKAYQELQWGQSYHHLIINHDTEDSDHWRFHPPLGEAGATVRQFVDIVTGITPHPKTG
jgi:guanylate kinase